MLLTYFASAPIHKLEEKSKAYHKLCKLLFPD
jgi:hypothetical protein